MGTHCEYNVSVCMATYNGEKYIRQQIETILMQLNKNDELIISDDGSNDKTLFIIENFKDERIRVFKNENGPNVLNNVENALKKAKGEYIFLSDQDDIWMKNKINILSNLLNTYDLVVSDCEIINEEDELIYDSFFKKIGEKRGIIKNLYKNPYFGCCMAFKKKILQHALPFPKNIPMHDIWIGYIGELYGKTFFCDDKLIKYRRHKDNTSPATEISKSSFSKKIFSRINLIYSLLKRYILEI